MAYKVKAHFLCFQLRLDGKAVSSVSGAGRFATTSACRARNYLRAEIPRLTLRMKKFDSDVVEGDAGVRARDVREAAARVADLAVGHYDARFRLAGDGVDEVSGAKADVGVGQVVLVEQRGVVRRDAHAEHADVFIFKDEMVMRFLPDRNGDGSLGGE
jgi:hypothetical protein